MALVKLALSPDSSSYSVADGEDVIATKLDGGLSRYRLDILGASSKVSVKWICDRTQYKYLRAFYSVLINKGATPFIIDLILNDPLPVEHVAYFIPGSMALTNQQGCVYEVSAQLEVEPISVTDDDVIFAALYGEFGSNYETEFPAFEDMFDNLMNVQIPADLVL